MTLSSETEKSPREIAALIIQFWLDEARNGVALATLLLKQDEEMLIGAIDKALRDRDERAAKIADAHDHDGPSASLTLNQPATMGYRLAAQKIASAIRGKA